MAFFGGSWDDDKKELDHDIGPLSHWLEDKYPDDEEIDFWESSFFHRYQEDKQEEK